MIEKLVARQASAVLFFVHGKVACATIEQKIDATAGARCLLVLMKLAVPSFAMLVAASNSFTATLLSILMLSRR